MKPPPPLEDHHLPTTSSHISAMTATSSDTSWPPSVWTRSDLDGFLLFEAAIRGDLHIYTEEPELPERERLTSSGQIIVWDETAISHAVSKGKSFKIRWHHTVPWSASRMIRNYLVRSVTHLSTCSCFTCFIISILFDSYHALFTRPIVSCMSRKALDNLVLEPPACQGTRN